MATHPHILTGKVDSHVTVDPAIGCPLEPSTLKAVLALQKKASLAGFQLEVVSGFRSFDRQLAIWNAKARGEKPLLDRLGNKIATDSFSALEKIHAILLWSALPGASRHHWGTDLDVIDRNAVPANYQIQLTPDEVSPTGIFGKFHAWLDKNLAQEGFFRPYQKELGGVSPERWHLSYAPLSTQYLSEFKLEWLRTALEESSIEMKEALLENLERLFEQYVLRISKP